MSVKILFVSASTRGGGAERMLFNIIRSLSPEYEIRLLITSKEKISSNIKLNISVENLNKEHASMAFYSIYKVVKSFKPDYMFTTSSSIGYMLIWCKLLSRVSAKIFIRVAVPPSEIVTKSVKNTLLKYVFKLFYCKCDNLIAQTEYMKNDVVQNYHVDESKVLVIRNIVDKNFLDEQSDVFIPSEFDNDDYNIVASGALYSVKGFDLLIQSIVPIVHEHKNVHLWILGQERYEVGYKKYLQNLIITKKLSDNVHLLGYRSNPYPYYKCANLLVMSSRHEGFPNVVMEALYLKTPVVVTNCVDWGGIVNEGLNGFVVEKNSIQALTVGINKAISVCFIPQFYEIQNFDYNTLFV